MNKIFIALTITLLLLSTATAHEDTSDIDIHLTPQQAFQSDGIAIEAGITENSTPVSGLRVTFVVDKHGIGLSESIAASEREPGRYFIKYAFTQAGQHEIHVEFLHNGEEIRKTFDIDVLPSSSDTELFSTVAIAAAALAALYILRSRNFKKALIILAIILALTGLAYSVYSVYATGAAQRGVVVCTDKCYWTAHIHTEVDVNICGKEFRFPVEKGRLDRPHTHEEKNLIHFHERLLIDPVTKEILNPQPLTLGAFFDAMEVQFDENKVLDKTNGDSCNNQSSSVKMFVNGKPSALLRDYIWKDGDKINIVFDEKPKQNDAESVKQLAEKQTQKATAELTPELTLPIIIGFALVDSINPCVIGVLLLLITVLIKSRKKKALLVKGTAYTIGVYLTYLIGGVTLLSVFNAVRDVQVISQAFYIVIGALVLLAAFLEIKDYFWYGRFFSLAIPKRFVKTIEKSASRTTGVASAMLFGVLVTLIELPCTGAPYLAIITMMSQSGVQFASALLLLLLYNLVFVLPLIIIIYLAYKGVAYKKIESWRREHKGKMRLAVGLMLLGIATWIITTVADVMLYLVAGSIIIIAAMALTKRIEHDHIKFARKTELKIKYVVKRSGRKEKFSPEKLFKSVQKAFKSARVHDNRKLESVMQKILKQLSRKKGGSIASDEIRDITEYVLLKKKLDKVAKHYIIYRYA